MKWFSRKPFAALLISMAIVALVPLLLNNIFYNKFRDTVVDQHKSLAGESLRFSVQQIDKTLLDLTSLGMDMSQDLKNINIPKVHQLDASSRMEIYDVSQELSNIMKRSSEYINSIYIYSPASKCAVGNQGVYYGPMVHKRFYNDREISVEEMNYVHEEISYGQLVPLGDNKMTFIRTISKNSRGLVDKQLVVLLKNSFYNNLIDKANVMDGIFLLLDGSNVLATSNKADVELNDEGIMGIIEHEDDGILNLEGKSMVIYTISSKLSNYGVKALIPYHHLLQKSSEMQNYYWMLLLASIVLAGVLMVFFGRWTMLPINHLIDYIRDNYKAESGDSQGLEQIKSAVETLLDREHIAREQLDQYEDLIGRNRLREMLRGNGHRDAELIIPADCLYVVVCFSTSSGISIEEQNQKIMAAQQALPFGCFCRTMILNASVVQILGQQHQDFCEILAERLLTAEIEWLDNKDTLTVSAAFSSIYMDPNELEHAYNEACMAMEFSHTKVDSVIVSFSSCEFKAEYFLRDWKHLDKQLRLSRLLSKEKFDDASQMLASLFPSEFLEEYFPQSDISDMHLASLKYQFLHNIDSISEVSGMEQEVRNQLLHELIYCKTHRELYRMTDKLLSELSLDSHEIEIQEDVDLDRIQEIKEYIGDNYADPQMNVSSVAEVFGMTGNNLSQLFSRKADSGVLDYIHGVRMDHAEEMLLNNEDVTIQDIATWVGYTSILTFNRRFKANYGMPPSEYKKQHKTS